MSRFGAESIVGKSPALLPCSHPAGVPEIHFPGVDRMLVCENRFVLAQWVQRVARKEIRMQIKATDPPHGQQSSQVSLEHWPGIPLVKLQISATFFADEGVTADYNVHPRIEAVAEKLGTAFS